MASLNAVASLVLELLFIGILGLWWLALLPRFLLQQKVAIKRWWSGKDRELHGKIKAQVEARRTTRLQGIISKALYVVPLLTIYSLGQAVINHDKDLPHDSIVGLNFEGMIISLLSLFAASRPTIAERLLSPLFLDSFMMLLFISVGFHAVLSADQNSHMYVSALNQSVTVQMLLAMLIGNTGTVGVVNVLNLGMQLWALNHIVPIMVPNTCLPQVDFLWRLLWNAAMTQLAATMMSSVLWAEAVASIGELEASRSEKTAAGLLNIMCDCVVSLREDFSFRQACPKLGAILLRDRASTNSTTSFCRFLSEEDQQRFQKLVSEESGAGTFHVDLISSMSGKVPVQVFHTRWIDADDKANFLLGLTEEKEVDQFPDNFAADVVETNLPEIPKVVCSKDRTTAEEGSRSDSDSGSSRGETSRRSRASSLSRWSFQELYCRAQVTIAAQVVEQSDECAALFNFLPGENNLFSRMESEEAQWVMDWLRNLHMRQTVKVPPKGVRTETFGEITLHSLPGVSYTVVLAARFLPTPIDEGYPLIRHLDLLFSPPMIERTVTGADLLRDARRRSSSKRRSLQKRAAAAGGRICL